MADEGLISKFSLLLLFLSITSTTKCSENDEKHRVNVILIGATGDLAKKYLWQAFFDLYLNNLKIQEREQGTTFRFYGAARMAKERGSYILEDILRNSVKCLQDNCQKKKAAFFKLCRYSRLKDEKDYEELQDILENSLEKNEVEIGRLFYFSVPPFAYANISRYVHSKCRPKDNGAWTRVVLEKPFGSNFRTARELSEKFSKYLKEEEVYRIDHYLGKSGVRQITEFRLKNRFTYEKIWNRDFIEQVKIVLKEKVDVEGRMGYYDHYGVIRDVFQNHLTELLVLIASELPHDKSEETVSNSKKSELLKSVRIVSLQDALFGQYKKYITQLRKEILSDDVKHNSSTPTFSAVSMHIDNERWFGVPFVLLSGKSLDTQLAYVQIQFKRSAFCVGNTNSNCKPKDIIFYIQGEELRNPVTGISKSLPKVNLPNGWRDGLNITTSPIFPSDKVYITPPLSCGAYSCLIQDVFLGNKEMFVSTDDLLLSWKIWTPLLEMSAILSPRLYTPEKIEELDFEIVRGKIKFISEKTSDKCPGSAHSSDHQYGMQGRSRSFRGNKFFSGLTVDVVQQLANDITAAAQFKVHSGSTFHLALSGGSTPQQLFQILVHTTSAFPWQQTHVWLVDERCVNLSHDQSNFRNIYDNLLKHVDIPFVNIHAMPVDIAGRWCEREDKTDLMYEELLKYHTSNGSLDFVVLGVGNDGHTASLFPRETILKSTRWVEITTSNNSELGGLSRMTLTLPVLSIAKNIAVLILGESKIGVVSKLLDGVVDIEGLPITGVVPVDGNLSWYIDNDALDV